MLILQMEHMAIQDDINTLERTLSDKLGIDVVVLPAYVNVIGLVDNKKDNSD